LVFDPVIRGYDIQAMGAGIVKTIADSQVDTGLIPDIAPEFTVFSGGFRDDPNWGSAMILLPLMLYKTYGDVDLLTANYALMRAYLDYLTSKSSDYLLNYGLGDWITFDNTTPVGITASYGYAKGVAGMITIANAIGNTSDATTYSGLLDNILASFHATYFNNGNTSYGSDSQASNALALDMGAVPEKYQTAIINNIVTSIVNNTNHLTVGEIALPSLIRSLHSLGADDTMYDMVVNLTSPSYAYQVLHGATSLTERWDGPTASCGGCNSLNHFMLGYIDSWLAQLSGVSQSNSSYSWNSIDYSPIMLKNLTTAASSYRSPKGIVAASWVLDDKQTIYYNVTVPVGAIGTVSLPFERITERGKSVKVGKDGVISMGQLNGTTTIVIGSGSYVFTAS
jgi:alpha-L-rhamnosidase